MTQSTASFSKNDDHGPTQSERIAAVAKGLEAVLYETKRVVIGQDAMLERVLVAMLAGGHVLLEGVPGLAKTLTVNTLATVTGGTFKRVQFTPDLVPADLVGTRIWRPDTGTFDTQLGPVFGNLLLADEINRAPAKVQSALLEVMQERQVTLGGTTHKLPEPFLVLATQNPIESEGTYPLPEAQVDRFLLKVIVDYPELDDEAEVVRRSIGAPADVRALLTPEHLVAYRQAVRDVPAEQQVLRYAVRLADATRHPERYGLPHLAKVIEIGASPRGPIGLVQAGQALAVLRGRDYVTARDIHDLAADVLRHRMVLSYEAHADGITADEVLSQIMGVVDPRATGSGSGPQVPAPGYTPEAQTAQYQAPTFQR
ncbi:MAG: MoxR family ATPase [Solirubrobacteraceae bacterium]|nr:MoxR family ATPase [Solirubrobacteraceae bacterium]